MGKTIPVKLLPHHRALLQKMFDDEEVTPENMQERMYCDTCVRRGWAFELTDEPGTFRITDEGIMRLETKSGRPSKGLQGPLAALETFCGGLKALSERVQAPVVTIKKWDRNGIRPHALVHRKNLQELAVAAGEDPNLFLEPKKAQDHPMGLLP
jgi:hypothetical protein